ncbi:phosphopantetheine-binding protein, partial [Pelagicoccus sp. SDUM812002]|uniref:phosphopantetheine-binding protein n=1 Tax=Pelagicoccus sp. SDUM812002 TaxID=3041266 RepID=UPI00280CEABD
VYAEVLGVERVGLDDDFFALGGHSLKAVRAMHMISDAESFDLDLTDLFLKTTPRQVALMIRTNGSIDEYSVHDGDVEILRL